MNIFRHPIVYMCVLVFSCLLMLETASAAPKALPADVLLTLADTIYCDAYSMVPLKKVKGLLLDGAIVSSSWQFKLSRQRDYWFNQTIANTEIIHQVTPDLITGRWVLLDVGTGVVQTTRSLQHALAFLLETKHTPITTRKTLQQWDESEQNLGIYTVHVRLHVRDAIILSIPWRAMFRLGKTIGIRSFSLP